LSFDAISQNTPPTSAVNAPPTTVQANAPTNTKINATLDSITKAVSNSSANMNDKRFLSSYEFIICVMLLSFAVVLFIIYLFLFRSNKILPYQVVKLSIVTLIIFATLFLIAAGYDNSQIASAMGLLGTIAGYILGKQAPPPIPAPAPPIPTPAPAPSTTK
jgi:hypothetical protein